MKTQNTIKRQYAVPSIEWIKLDNDISLTLDSSTPPSFDGEDVSKVPDYFNNDPFKTT
jgi:hypothetical protein